jgi:hypothetical protein
VLNAAFTFTFGTNALYFVPTAGLVRVWPLLVNFACAHTAGANISPAFVAAAHNRKYYNNTDQNHNQNYIKIHLNFLYSAFPKRGAPATQSIFFEPLHYKLQGCGGQSPGS